MAASTATADLAAALKRAAPGHRATQLVARLLGDDRPPLVAAVVGPSGAGKSSLVNAIAGTAVAVAGVLRPTTTITSSWHAPGGELRLMDTPSSDHLPEESLAALRRADVGVVVTSHSRYADAATWACVRTVRESGLPLLMVVNRLEAASADLVVDDVVDRLDGEPIIPVLEDGLDDAASRLLHVLTAAAGDLPAVRAYRRHTTVGPAAAAVRSLALDVRIEQERTALLAEAVSEAGDDLDLGSAELFASAGDESTLIAAACAVVDRVAEPIVASLAGLWERLDLEPPSLGAVGEELGEEDARGIRGWRDEVIDRFRGGIRPALLRRRLEATVVAAALPAAAGDDRPFPLILRLTLGARRHSAVAESRARLGDLLRSRVAARIDVFRRSVPTPPPADPDELEALAGKMGDEHPVSPLPAMLDGAVA